MKTPDEIKEAMLHCSPVSCRSTGCPYKADTPKYEGDMPVCRMKLWHDMKHLIQQIEAQNAEKDEGIKHLESGLLAQADVIATMGERIQQLEAERDAAVGLIPNVCAYCKWYGTKHGGFFPDCKNPSGCKNISGIVTGWEWRGVQKEE